MENQLHRIRTGCMSVILTAAITWAIRQSPLSMCALTRGPPRPVSHKYLLNSALLSHWTGTRFDLPHTVTARFTWLTRAGFPTTALLSLLTSSWCAMTIGGLMDL